MHLARKILIILVSLFLSKDFFKLSTSETTASIITQPFGIDVCSGVRINGNLDEAKLNAF